MEHWRNDTGTETLGPCCPPQIPYQLQWGAAAMLYNFIHGDTGYSEALQMSFGIFHQNIPRP